MKKNLRIVSAAAALLAVAPVAATAIATPATTVSAATATTDAKALADAQFVLPTLNLDNGTTAQAGLDQVKDAVSKLEDPGMDVAHPAGISATTNKGVKVHIYYGQGSLTGGLTAANFASQQVNGKLANGSHVATVGINAGTAVANRVTLNVYADQSIEGQSITLNDGTKVDILSGSNKNKAGEYVGQITPETVNVAVPVNVATTSSNSTTDTTTPSDKINAGEGSDSIFNADANMSVVINAVAARFNGNNVVRKSAINGSISATVDGKSVTALLHGGTNTTIYSDAALTKTVPATQLQSDTKYYADFNNVTLNLGNSYASKSEKFTLAKGHFTNVPAGAKVSKDGKTITVTVDNTGVARLGNVVVPFYAYDATNMRDIHFYAFKTGNEVQSVQ